MKHLYELEKGSKISVDTEKGIQIATFHHMDGMYSYCTVDAGYPDAGKIVALGAMTPVSFSEALGAYLIDDNQ